MTTRNHPVPTAWVVAIALTAFACRTPPPQVATAPATPQTAAAPGGVPNLYDDQRLVGEYVSSGGYAERTFKLPNPVYFLP